MTYRSVTPPERVTPLFIITVLFIPVIPVPVRATVCGLPDALSDTLTLAVLEPVVVGVNVALIVQLDPEPNVAPQVFVCEKSPALVPVMEILLIVNVEPPEFVNKIAIGELLVETI